MSGAPSLEPGTRVGPYEVLALLGEGGMGQVYRARDERLSREVALKVVHADLAQDAERLRRFEHEARAAGTLNHPNIVAVYDTGQSDGSPYIVSELLQGETLRDRMATGAVGTRKAVDYAVQIARGLAAAHEKGIVHRDLKPENLFLTRDGLVKILDFGIAKLGRPGDEKAGTDIETLSHTGTSPGTMLGTAATCRPNRCAVSDGSSFGPLRVRRRAVRGADRQARVPGHDRGGHLQRDSARGSDRTDGQRARAAAGLRPRGQPLSREVARGSLPDRTRSGVRPRGCDHGVARPRRESLRRRNGACAGSEPFPATASSPWHGPRLAGGAARRPRSPLRPSFQRLTFRLGQVQSAQFTPDGETIVYSAKLGQHPDRDLLDPRDHEGIPAAGHD